MSVSSPTKSEPTETFRYWQDLQILLLRSPRSSDFLLKRQPPVPLPPGSNLTNLFQACGSLKRRLLLNRHLLSCLALFKNPDRELQTRLNKNAVLDFFPQITSTAFTAASWVAVPVPVVQGNSAVTLTLMLGLKPGTGRVLVQDRPCIDQSSRKAIETLFHSLLLGGRERKKDLLIWTLQHEDSRLLMGTSLGLPVAIGISLLMRGKQWPQGMFASGQLTGEGQVKAVKHIREKTQAVSRDLQLFIIPAQNSCPAASTKYTSVQTLAEALFALNCFQDGIHDGRSIALFRLAAEDPEILLGQFNNLPPEFFRLHDLSPVLQKIQQRPEWYFAQLASCLKRNSYKIEQASALASLFTCDAVLELAAGKEFATVDYCLGALALYNHVGDVERSKKWSTCAEQVAVLLKQRKKLSQIVNNDFVSQRFNRYDFREDVPVFFQEYLEHEQKLYELQKDDSWQLGAMYGTLAQHYGFCGPVYLGKLREIVQKALDAFGHSSPQEHPRIQAYLLYGLLDSQKYAEAGSLLPQYLNVPQDAAVQDWFSRLMLMEENQHHGYSYAVSLICRYLAEQPTLLPVDMMESADLQKIIHKTLEQKNHPWQLTALNLARIGLHLREENSALQLLKHAVAVCLQNGETMQAMALLPLSLLHEYGLAQSQHYQQAEQVLEMIRSNTLLQQSHFIDLLSCQTGRAILEKIVDTKTILFPFSYR